MIKLVNAFFYLLNLTRFYHNFSC